MSGMRNLANAIANDPSFVKQASGVMTKAQADELVCDPRSSAKAYSPKPTQKKG